MRPINHYDTTPQILQLDLMQTNTDGFLLSISECFEEADLKNGQADVA